MLATETRPEFNIVIFIGPFFVLSGSRSPCETAALAKENITMFIDFGFSQVHRDNDAVPQYAFSGNPFGVVALGGFLVAWPFKRHGAFSIVQKNIPAVGLPVEYSGDFSFHNSKRLTSRGWTTGISGRVCFRVRASAPLIPVPPLLRSAKKLPFRHVVFFERFLKAHIARNMEDNDSLWRHESRRGKAPAFAEFVQRGFGQIGREHATA